MARRLPPTPPPPPAEPPDVEGYIEPIEINLEMERSFLEYSMSVIVSRALPDVRDGLKPVHRRILYSMFDQGLRPDRPHAKCAKVVGEVMGTFHPHGDTAIYDALVRMAQDFSMRHPLVDGHGNFGGMGPDEGAAAMRYTECRLDPLALELLAGIDEETVEFSPNYDNTDQQPDVLPSRFPNLLVNGSQGIAVGMATKIPPHNLAEVVDAALHLLEHPGSTPDDLMAFVKGPDFPTGGEILGRQGILDAYRTGRGSIRMRGIAEIEEGRTDTTIVVTQLPYEVSPGAVAVKIHDLVESGELDGIAEVDDHSANRQVRLVIRLKRDANANVVLNKLYKSTPLQTTFAVNALALVDGVPRTLDLARLLEQYLLHQVDVVTRRSQFRLRKAEARAHIVEGLLRAIDQLDAVIATIRGSEDRAAARAALMAAPFSFSEEQATHILDLTLGRLTRLGRAELDEEMQQLGETIAELQSILSDEAKLKGVIATELGEVRDRFADERRTEVVNDPGELGIEDLVAQGLPTPTHAYLLLFSNRGKVYRLRGHEIPMKERTARGTAVVNLLNLAPAERIQAIVPTKDFPTDKFLVFATAQGQVKKTAFSEYDKSRREGFIALNLRDEDELVRVVPTAGDDDVFMVTLKGMTIRFSERDVRAMGRAAEGVRGVRLRADDRVVSLDVARDDVDLLVVTDAGYGKRTKLERFHRQGRGGMGVRGIRLTAVRGHVVAAFMVHLDDDVILASTGGVLIRTPVREIASQGRDATGVRVMNLDAGQSVAAVAAVAGDEPEA